MLCTGSLVYLDIAQKYVTKEGLTTIHYDGNCPVLFESISIEKYPSSNDFFGKSTKVSHNEPVIILKKIGRPWRMSLRDNWEMYDIYNVQLKSGEIRQIFAYNLSEKIIKVVDALPKD